MYVILNIHHDNEKASGFTNPDYDSEWAAGNKDCYIYPDKEHLDSSVKYVTKMWEQLGTNFKDCDEHLVFETMNEPRQVGNIHEWWYADDDCCHEALECITKINQAAVDTIRATGRNNSDCFVMIPATSAKAEAAMQSKYFQMPKDSAKDRLILSVHAYEPFDFSMNKTSDGAPTEFTDSMKKSLDDMFDTLYVAFIKQNIPVVIGEFGATNRDNTQARTEHTAYYYAATRARGISCCMWDNSNPEGENEAYRFLDRTNKKFIYDSIADASEKYGTPRTDFSGAGIDGVVSNTNCTLYPDGKVMFPSPVGEKAELYFDIDTKKSLCGGGCIAFIEEVDGVEYWVAYEWQTNDSGVVKIDMTKPNQVKINDVKVEESGNEELFKKFGEKCMNEKEANLAYWWAAQSWENNYPDGTAHNYVDVKSAVITSPVAVTTPDTVYGDVNEDGEINIADAVLIMQSLVNKDEYKIGEQGKINGDVVDNGSGITSIDALGIQACLANLVKADQLPITSKDLESFNND